MSAPSAVELLGLLKESLRAMEDECDSQESDVFDLSCGNCDGAIPVPHSFGCRIRNAIFKAEKILRVAS